MGNVLKGLGKVASRLKVIKSYDICEYALYDIK
jgi:hypothetical protein